MKNQPSIQKTASVCDEKHFNFQYIDSLYNLVNFIELMFTK